MQQAVDKAADLKHQLESEKRQSASDTVTLVSKVKEFEQKVETLQQSVKVAVSDKDAAAQQFSADRDQLRKQFENRNGELLERTKELAQAKKEVARLQDAEAELQNVRLLLGESTELLERKNDECATLEAFKAKTDMELPELQKKLAAAQENIQKVQGMLEAKIAEVANLGQLNATLDGEAKASKKLLQLQTDAGAELTASLNNARQDTTELQAAKDALQDQCYALQSEKQETSLQKQALIAEKENMSV